MEGTDIKLLMVVLMTALSTFDQSCALPARDVKTLEPSSHPVLAATPSVSIPKWTVRDENNKICMLMAMIATIQLDPEVPIPSSAAAISKTGSCDPHIANFNLQWTDGLGYTFTVSTVFKANGNSYKMDKISGTRSRGLNFFSWSDQSSSYPSATVGNSMNCSEFNSGTIYFTKYQFQPFAQQSQEQYGKAEECSLSSGSSFWAFLVIAAICLVVVAVVVGVVVIIVKKVKTRSGYKQIQ